SASAYASPAFGSLGGGLVNTADSTSGKFTFTGSTFSLSEPIAGLATGATLTAINVSTAPVITPVSHSVSISQLTSQSLKIHTEYIYTYTVNNLSQTYKMDDDYYYTRYL
ncbi:MAG: hypothetical protein ACXVIY_06830, partial [Mucilaginibacter sp.]